MAKFYPYSINSNLIKELKSRYRYKCERINNKIPYLEIENDYTGKSLYTKEFTSSDTINYDDIIKEFAQSPSYDYNIPILELDKCKKMVSELSGNLTADSIAKIRNAFSFCDEKYMSDLLKYTFEDIFFNKYSKGKIIYVRLDTISYQRSGLIRCNYSTDNYSELIYELTKSGRFKGFNVLNKWLMIESHEFFKTLISIAEFFFFPYILSFHANWKLGIYFIFIPDEVIKYGIGKFPRDILDFARSSFNLAYDTYINTENINNIYSKYCFKDPPSFDSYYEFLIWFLNKTENLISKSFDLCNFTEKNDNTKIDPIYALEYNISILHILKIGLSILSSNNSYYNKSITFQVADMLDAICNKADIGITNSDTEFFKKLFDRNYFLNVFSNIINQTNIKLSSNLTAVMKDLYDELINTVKNSIWLEYKLNGNNVNVKNKTFTGDNTEPIEIFTANIIRALRNTHHGYLTRNDPSNRPSRYLSLTTGELPSSLSSLVLFWILCLLEDKNKFIGKT